MKLFENIIAKLPFVTYSKKVDPVVRNILAIKKIKFIPLILVFRKNPDALTISRLKRLGLKLKHTLPFINGVCGSFPQRNFENLLGILEINKIYFDGKAYLTGSINTDNKISNSNIQNKTYLTGKGVGVAFIDSGIYPHPDMTKPKNRIVGFRDFLDDINSPYDSNGHGTACIGTAFAASTDGRFKSIAYDSDIICARVFDNFSSAFYSDILAAMQWIIDIKEKHNIKIIVLPFGTSSFSKDFDILSRSAATLWKEGLFVCACSGNQGPNEGSITSPGVCPFVFTTGACNICDNKPKTLPFSGCGPVDQKINKPDAIMPGYNVNTINSDITYLPKDKKASPKNLPSMYREVSGTSVSASLTAAAAALLYQKNPQLNPDDIKNILKVCSISSNELKTMQGAGMIDIKKIEEYD